MAKPYSVIKAGDQEFVFEFGAEETKSLARERQRKVMKEAWRRARKGAEKFGGKAHEYISESMKIANRIVPKVSPRKVSVEREPGQTTFTEYDAQYNVIVRVLRQAQQYEGRSGGAAMEVSNASSFLEYLEDLKAKIGVQAIIENLEKARSSANKLSKILAELVQAHYDDEYAKWAGGLENFKNKLREIERMLEGEQSGELVGQFF